MAKSKFSTQMTAPHVGQMLARRIKAQRISKAALARAVGRSGVTLLRFTQRPSLQTEVLWQLCTVMKHNFFLDLAAQLPPDFTTHAPDSTRPLQQRIAALEEENKLLKIKVETLMQVVRK
ncbi:hypothetical protein [Aequorivita vladivostokensis]|uniref:HTH cro/C1-type domain-containing protein n=1 Tax=Aequorivita vladivostokensis TaxID=171194 RepID=A0ABR5DLB4_9FLAO|nr:hypothetical protein [Aequorivita vladivostokensis]KJJ39569.1 hypothetical protein MB09_04890 [Aequorivita vladivostokensis]